MKRLGSIFAVVIFVCVFFAYSYADLAPGAPSAKRILFIRDTSQNFVQVYNELLNNASSCTSGIGPANIVDTFDCANDNSVWPSSFAGYDEVWDIRWNWTGGGCTYTLDAARRADLQGVLAAGGGVFLMSENNPWYKPGVIEFVNSVTILGGFDTSGPRTGGDPEFHILNPSPAVLLSAENFGIDYLNLSTCGTGTYPTQYPGSIPVAELAGGFPVVISPDGLFATGIAFTPATLNPPYNKGKLFVWYDKQAFNELANCSSATMCLIKNIMDFLVADPTGPTPTFTETATPTNSPTVTETNTLGNTATFTPTYTQTWTFTSTETFTTTPTMTSTFTMTTSNTPTITPTPTPPFEFKHETNYPNPFTEGTWILYSVSRDCKVTVKAYTISGEKVADLKQDAVAGYNRLFWDGTNNSGKRASSGVYVYFIEAVSGKDKGSKWSKMSILR